MTRNIRALLEDMVSEPDTENHAARLEELGEKFPHSIDVLQSTRPLGTYNCVLHAFGLHEYHVEIPIWYAKTDFLKYLIANGHLSPCPARAGAVVIWSLAGHERHVGRLLAPTRAVSKWGTGLLFAHGLNEIPERYGEVSGIYDPIPLERAFEHLMASLSWRGAP